MREQSHRSDGYEGDGYVIVRDPSTEVVQQAIPAQTQRKLGLTKRRNNHLISYSIRSAGSGRWNHLLSKLTSDNEFEIPAGFDRIRPGQRVEVKIHRVVADVPLAMPRSAGDAVLALPSGEDVRIDGSRNIDAYLYGGERP